MIGLKKALDNIFWDDSSDAYIVRLLEIFETGLYDNLIQSANEVYKNWFPLKASHLGFYSPLFPVKNRVSTFTPPFYNPPSENGFEYFRIKVISFLMAMIYGPTYEMVNWLAGGFSLQPCFIETLAYSLTSNWWLNKSYLDGVFNPGIYNEERTWLKSTFEVITGIKIYVFSDGVNQLVNTEEFNEFKSLIKALYAPFEVYFYLYNTRNPTGYELWSSNFGNPLYPNGYNDFDLSSFFKMHKEKEYYVLDSDIGETDIVGFDTLPKTLSAGLYEFNVFEFLLSSRYERQFSYSEDGGISWKDLRPLQKLEFSVPVNIIIRMRIKFIKDVSLYRFFSMMLRKLS